MILSLHEMLNCKFIINEEMRINKMIQLYEYCNYQIVATSLHHNKYGAAALQCQSYCNLKCLANFFMCRSILVNISCKFL